jgi:hypothetical protein
VSEPPDASAAFDKARDWRAHELTLLKEDQRREYDRIVAEGKKKEQARAKQLDDTRRERTETESRRRLLDRERLVLELFASKETQREEAKREAERAIRIHDENARKEAALETQALADEFLREKKAQRDRLPSEKTLARIFERASRKERDRGDGGRSL